MGTVRRKKVLLRGAVLGTAVAAVSLVGMDRRLPLTSPSRETLSAWGATRRSTRFDFALNGYPHSGLGYNSSATVNRVIAFDATADGNGSNI